MIRCFREAFALGCLAALILVAWPGPIRADDGIEFFEKKVRPVLAENCYTCHGKRKQESGLRLDSPAAIQKGSDAGPVVVPGDPDKSRLVQAIRHTDDLAMPPGEKLPEAAIEAIAQWIRLGMPAPDATSTLAAGDAAAIDEAAKSHWAFQPIREPAVPKVKSPERAASAIDAFVLAKLEAHGLAPSPKADRQTLIRRVTFDLTGLPPTEEEIHAFLADTSPDAFARVVDRLLASPHYGERWARHWLDVARYADTKGYVFTEERRYPYAFTYRDYVIDAFNRDLPFDRFILEQIAADQLPKEGSSRHLAAMGFLTVGRRFLNDVREINDDRIDVVTRGFLGLTVSCARCHDHKYDPVPSADYYSLYGIFANSVEPAELPPLEQPKTTPSFADYQQKLAEKQNRLTEILARRKAEAERELREKADRFLIAAFEVDFDPRSGKLADAAKRHGVSAATLRYAVQRLRDHLKDPARKSDPVWWPWVRLAGVSEKEFAAKAALVWNDLGRGSAPMVDPRVRGVLAGPPPGSMRELVARYASLLQPSPMTITIFAAAQPAAPAAPEAREPLAALFSENGPFGVPERAVERLFDRATRQPLERLRNEIAELNIWHPGAPARAMVMVDAPKIQEQRVFIRGNPGRPGDVAPRQFLKVLAGEQRKPFAKGSGRLELAQAIADPKNPLTPRVIVNRVWLHHFGAGLVRTPSDFGLRGERPSHPELLDYLAARFLANGWSLKRLHREILLSNTYQQVSDNRAEGLARDPENRLLWKYNRRRLEFEAMRDSLLAVAGTLDRTMGGRPVSLTSAPFTTRRAIYGMIDRQNLEGVFRTFDFAGPNASSPQRFITVVPQQALFLMNNPFVEEQARRLAAGVVESSSISAGDDARIDALFRRVFGRSAERHEAEMARRYVAGARTTSPQAAKDAAVEPWAGLAQALLMTNEFMYVD